MENIPEQTPRKDDTFSGLVIIAGVLILVIGFVYLLSIQKTSDNCETAYNPDGTVRAGCALSEPITSPAPETEVELLDQLNKNEVSEVDQQLQEAAQDFMQKQNQRIQQQQQQQQSQPQIGQ